MTKIEWAEKSWNPVTGCTKISPGCKNCYADAMCRRFWKRWGRAHPPHHFLPMLHEARLMQPASWKNPSVIFVCSMGDLFHEWINFDHIDNILAVMRDNPQHKFLILTKRPEQMNKYFAGRADPPPNVGLGVSAEDQPHYDKRVGILDQISAALKFVSLEPLLKPIRLHRRFQWSIDWVIVGAESVGSRPGRPCKEEWIESIVEQCRPHLPVFVKQNHHLGILEKRPLILGKRWEQQPSWEDLNTHSPHSP